MIATEAETKLQKDPIWLQRRYWDERYTLEGMAKEAGCNRHTIYYWMKKYGIPSRRNLSTAERFWGKVNIHSKNECWEWTGGKTGNGYGSFYFGGCWCAAHRAAWILTYGAIPKGLCVLHHCDHPWCMNPNHLFLGTNADNVADRVCKDRSARMRGEENPRAKLIESDRLEIRRLYKEANLYQREIAEMFGVAQTTISRVVRRNGCDCGYP